MKKIILLCLWSITTIQAQTTLKKNLTQFTQAPSVAASDLIYLVKSGADYKANPSQFPIAGDIGGTLGSSILNTILTAGSCTNCVLTWNAKGLVTSATTGAATGGAATSRSYVSSAYVATQSVDMDGSFYNITATTGNIAFNAVNANGGDEQIIIINKTIIGPTVINFNIGFTNPRITAIKGCTWSSGSNVTLNSGASTEYMITIHFASAIPTIVVDQLISSTSGL